MKQDFPIFKNYPGLVYLDSAATSQKPQSVIDAVTTFYTTNNPNIHRGIYNLSQTATDLYEKTREQVAHFINANESSEVVFTNGSTESINFVAFCWAKKFLQKGDIVVLSDMEHHANIVPWQQLKKIIGIELFYLPLTKEFRLHYQEIASLPLSMTKRIKLVSLSHASNVLGTINPLDDIIPYFKNINSEVKVCIDAAQSIPHIPIDVQKMDCDFLAFSSHKMLGPTGVGILYAKKELLSGMEPMLFGGAMIKKVTKEEATWAEIPDKFEGGTRNLEGVVGFGAAIEYLKAIGYEKIKKHETGLTAYMLEMFARQKNVILYGPKNVTDRVGVFSFLIKDIHPHDIAEVLNRSKIAVRTGHHCAQPLMQTLGIIGTARASIYLYNTKEDIDQLEEGIDKVKQIFKT